VVVTVGAEDRPEGISLRIQTAQSLEDEATRMQKSLRLYMRNSTPLSALSPYLAPQNDGQVVSLILIKENGANEVEIELPNRYRVGPQVASAMKAIPGIIEVEMA
jgi:DNA polymerase III subunit alpha